MPVGDNKNLDNESRCYQSAIRLLARREHSRLELMNKLHHKSFSLDVDLGCLCDKLEALNYLSDERFTEMFVRSRINRGQGQIKIRYELRQRGVHDSLVDFALQQIDTDWLALAKAQREKRFGREIPKDFKQRGRQSRFLLGRGFSGETIRLVFF